MSPKRPSPDEERDEPTGAELFDEETRTARRLADFSGGGAAYEGETVNLEALEDQEVEVLAFRVQPSQFDDGDYVCFQAKVVSSGKLVVCNTSTTVPVKRFLALDPAELPLLAVFFKQEPKKGGKPYWNIR
jgi:hypothetical protein